MNMLLTQMLSHADPSQVEGLTRFFKTGPGQYGFGDRFLGIKVPVTREVVRRCWKEMLPADWPLRVAEGESAFPELEECIRSEYHEVRLAALLTLVEIFRHAGRKGAAEKYFSEGFPKNKFSAADSISFPPPTVPSCPAPTVPSFPPPTGHLLRRQCIDFYLSHTQFINNWDLVDLSCYPLLGEWLLDAPDRSLLYSLARDGKTIWEQRIGIVSTMTFVRHGQLKDTFAIADILLHHPHDLIHKAVGWLLREAGKRDKAALEAYLREPPSPSEDDAMPDPSVISSDPSVISRGRRESRNLPRYQTMPRTMLRYAIEKFPEAERQAYLNGHAL